MSRFIAPDLSALGDVPQVVPVNFEDIRNSRDTYLIAALAQRGIGYNVNTLETDPLVIAYSEGGGYQEMLWRQRVNEAIFALVLAKAIGKDLDHIAVTYAGIGRLVYANDPDDQPAYSQWDPVLGLWVEADEIFRERVKLAYEAFSTAGPEGAYIFHALELDGIRDIADAMPYSEEDAATYSSTLHADAYTAGKRSTPFAGRDDGDPVLAPEILLVVLPTPDYGAADQALLDRAYAAVTEDDVRPLGDNVRVEAASVQTYDIAVTLFYAPGADATAMGQVSRTLLEEYATARRRIGVSIQREVIGGRAAVDNTVTIEVTSPVTDINPGPKGAAQVGSITVNLVQTQGSWDDD